MARATDPRRPGRALGLLLTGVGVWGLMRSVISPFVARGDCVMEVLYTKRYLARGPRIVAIGGGTGLSTLLRGLKGYWANITAIVAVADDGGSSAGCGSSWGSCRPATSATASPRWPTPSR